jgi:hypothetical protein
VVVAPSGHPLAGKRSLTLKRLAAEPFVMREKASEVGGRSEGCAEDGAKLVVAMELSSTARNSRVESGLRLAVISRYACARVLHQAPGRARCGFPIRRTGASCISERKLPSSVTAFIGSARHQLADFCGAHARTAHRPAAVRPTPDRLIELIGASRP